MYILCTSFISFITSSFKWQLIESMFSSNCLSEVAPIILDVTKLTCFNEWITLGVKPTEPSEAYGYIKIKNIDEKLMNISKFVEKPSKTKAVRYLKTENSDTQRV